MSLKPEVEQLPAKLRQVLVDYAETRHDEHVCSEEGTRCGVFDALVLEIWKTLRDASIVEKAVR